MKQSLCFALLALAAVAAATAQAQTDVERALKKPAGKMVRIPAGKVPAFRLGKHEVTFAQWDACVADGGCGGYRPDDEGWGRGNRPVINVSWNDANAFITWLNGKTGRRYRLPTAAEWRHAAWAGTTTKYYWGDSIGRNRANCKNDECGDKYEHTAPVGSFLANPWGLHDILGNVSEWAQDCIADCNTRAFRGAAWSSPAWSLSSHDNYGGTRTVRLDYVGFRLARDK